MASPLEFFSSLIGQTIDQTPSAAGNWLAGKLLEVSEKHIKIQYSVRPDMCNPAKILHGGVASLMLDDAIGIANFVTGTEYLMTSINLSVDFLSSAQIGENLILTADLIRSGSNLNHWEAIIKKENGKIVAKASSNMIKTHIKISDLKL